jgi:toxin ParE1/3/4
VRVVFSPRAIERFIEIEDFLIARGAPAKAVQDIERLKNAARSLQAMPRKGRVVIELGDPDVRELVVAPYRLVYAVRESAIEVLTVIHGRQRFPLDEFLND